MTTVEKIVASLGLLEHPEGGFYKRVYASEQMMDARGNGELRPVCTAIIYLLEGRQFSAFHRIKSDELWFLGEATANLSILELQHGQLVETVLSRSSPSHCVKANTWFAAELKAAAADEFALVYCTVAPGFDFADFELARAGAMMRDFPQYAHIWSKLCIAND